MRARFTYTELNDARNRISELRSEASKWDDRDNREMERHCLREVVEIERYYDLSKEKR